MGRHDASSRLLLVPQSRHRQIRIGQLQGAESGSS
jgi:hypothetical protein